MTAVLDSDLLDEAFLDQAFAALANPTRRAILTRLAEGEASVNEIAEPFEMSLPAISRHVKVLESAGLIRQGRRAQYRPCTIDPAPLETIANWAEQYRELWEASFDRMDDYLTQIQGEQNPVQDTPSRQDSSQRKAE